MIHKSFFFCLWIWFSRGETDEVKSVSVTEGDSVTLNTDVTEIQSKDHILWVYRLNSSDIRIAEIHKQSIDMYDSSVMFGDRLRMDTQSGSLTIRNIRTTDSGLYKLSIFSRSSSYRSFSVNVYAHLPIPVIRDSSNCSSSSSSRSSVSRCSLVCSAVNVSHVTLSWYKGNSLLSSISVSDLSISLSLPLEVENQDNNTYSCVLNNPISNQTKHLNVTRLCQTQTCSELKSSHWVGILVSLVILAVLAVPAIIFFRRKSKQEQPQNVPTCEEEVCYTETTFRARSVHSTVRHCISVCRNLSFYHRRSEKSRLRLCVKAVAVSSCADKANGEDHVIYSSINVT
ncbi:CD48 antigen-like isoform X2 [Chanodichthys erythropterus]|uniref:CD48 antigen-like isoform X2 n=1 Tax=Chanodichthys erythropterus TaxID=933992 RepID=UPI00351EB11C